MPAIREKIFYIKISLLNKMSTKKKVQLTAVALLVIGILFVIPKTDWYNKTSVIGFISLICGTGGSIISIFIPATYVKIFSEGDWQGGIAPAYTIHILAKTHGQGKSPHVQIFIKDAEIYSMTMCDVNHDKVGNVTAEISSPPFDGKIVIT